MDYLLLWSGAVRGMRKTRIPAVPAQGFLHHLDETGAHVVPDRAAVRAAIPARLRASFDRAHMARIAGEKPRSDGWQGPFHFALARVDGSWITTLYLQPLDADRRGQREAA